MSGQQQSVDTTGLVLNATTSSVTYNVATTNIKSYNIVGNYVWLRAKISQFTEGSVNAIKYNY